MINIIRPKGAIAIMPKKLLIAVAHTKFVNCKSACTSCNLQFVHTKGFAALTQFCNLFNILVTDYRRETENLHAKSFEIVHLFNIRNWLHFIKESLTTL